MITKLDKANEIANQALDGIRYAIAGRIIYFRNNGKICFGKIQDQSGRIQFVLKKDENETLHKQWSKNLKIGDIVRLSGRSWTSSTNEKSLLVNEKVELLRRSVHPFPDKWKGIVDEETRLRKRYLDILLDPEYRNVFTLRSKLIQVLRDSLSSQDFIEIETPILAAQASGANARPFQTHHHSLDANLYLRIAPETYLKRALAAGFDRVFEIGKNFRNEGMDASHLQEFTSIEWYAAYWDYTHNLNFFDNCILPELISLSPNLSWVGENHETYLAYGDLRLKVSNIPRKKYADVFREFTGRYPNEIGSAKEIDDLFKRKVRPHLIQPVYLYNYPAHMSPLAERRKYDENVAEQWQLIVNGWELVKCYTELTDPVLQRKLLQEQQNLKDAGDEEAIALEEDFLTCMEYGIPPCSGLGLGIDRLVALLTNQKTLRDVIMFPILL